VIIVHVMKCDQSMNHYFFFLVYVSFVDLGLLYIACFFFASIST